MPFGLTNAPATFQRFINEVLGEILDEFVIAYLNDILVFSDNPKEHIRHVREVLARLEKAHLRIKLERCEFNVQETDFLGHLISPEGIHVEQNKVQAIKDWPPPTNLKELQQFSGLVNYYRRFVNGYGSIMAPLFNLLKKIRHLDGVNLNNAHSNISRTSSSTLQSWSNMIQQSQRQLKQTLPIMPSV